MMIKKSISTFVIAFLVFGFFFLALPEKGYSGNPMPPNGPFGCCQVPVDICLAEEQQCCKDFEFDEVNLCIVEGGTFITGGSCQDNGLCTSPEVITPIPTISQWGLIAMASILGVIGIIMIIRRKKVTA